MSDHIREMPSPAVDASPVAAIIRTLTSPWGERGWLRVYATATFMALFLSFTGAMGSNEAPMLTRLGYWLTMMLSGTASVQVVSLISCRLIKLEPLADAIMLFVLSVPAVTLTVWLADSLYLHRRLDPEMLLFTAGPVTVITFAMSALQYLAERTPRQSHVHPGNPQEPGRAFRERLPFKFRQADIHALSAEDHYLRVYTSAGQTLILMRLYDAIRELDGIEGSQVHRSWWVAKDAVRNVVRSDGKLVLDVKGDIEAPVSRSYAKILKREGWF